MMPTMPQPHWNGCRDGHRKTFPQPTFSPYWKDKAIMSAVTTFIHRNPCNQDEILDEVSCARENEIEQAVQSLQASQKDWGLVPLAERAERLRAWYDALKADTAAWVDALMRDVGKPRRDAEGEVGYGLSLLQYMIASLEDHETARGVTIHHRPWGLVGAITPWNNPFAIPIAKLAPALAYGNTVIWKPAPQASAIARRMMKSLTAVQLDKQLVLPVYGDAETGRLLAEHPAIDALSFTGSVAAGRDLAAACARHMRPFQGELGGNNAAIVLADADLDFAARDLAQSMFSFAGQRCTAVRRVIAEESVYQAFSVRLAAEIKALCVGQPKDPATQVGPVISAAVRDRLLSLCQAAVKQGAHILAGGGTADIGGGKGCWLSPAILHRLSPSSPVITDELFGPVAALMTAKDIHESIFLHNNVAHGLLGVLYSKSEENQKIFAENAAAGILSFNTARPALDAGAPFLGWKASGYGIAEHGRWDRDFYSRPQAQYGRKRAGYFAD
jgi:acyl-CoA reductase-like NAD-dependent aldehyde dehydrogenase